MIIGDISRRSIEYVRGGLLFHKGIPNGPTPFLDRSFNLIGRRGHPPNEIVREIMMMGAVVGRWYYEEDQVLVTVSGGGA